MPCESSLVMSTMQNARPIVIPASCSLPTSFSFPPYEQSANVMQQHERLPSLPLPSFYALQMNSVAASAPLCLMRLCLTSAGHLARAGFPKSMLIAAG